MSTHRVQQRELRNAQRRINFYLTGGARPVFVSRNILSGLLMVFWLIIWFRH